MRVLVLAVSVSVLGCGGGCSGPSEEPARAENGERASGGDTPERGEPAEVDPGPPPTVRVVGTVDPHARSVAVRVENRGDAETTVSGALVLQRRAGSAWEEVSARVDLRFDCRARAAECVTLAPGAVLLPPAWLGTIGDSQCVCTRCAPAPAGTYRFLARSCDGTHTVEGEPFELPPE